MQRSRWTRYRSDDDWVVWGPTAHKRLRYLLSGSRHCEWCQAGWPYRPPTYRGQNDSIKSTYTGSRPAAERNGATPNHLAVDPRTHISTCCHEACAVHGHLLAV